MESTPDTVITFMDSTKMVVRETVEEVAALFMQYQQAVRQPINLTKNTSK